MFKFLVMIGLVVGTLSASDSSELCKLNKYLDIKTKQVTYATYDYIVSFDVTGHKVQVGIPTSNGITVTTFEYVETKVDGTYGEYSIYKSYTGALVYLFNSGTKWLIGGNRIIEFNNCSIVGD